MGFTERADSVARWLERLVAGSGSADPLYVSNRTFAQKLRVVLLIGIPAIAAAVIVLLALGNYFQPAPPPQPAPVAAKGEVTRNVLADLDKTYHSESDADCSVSEVGISDGALVGKVRNDTEHTVHVADVVFDMTDRHGSQLGAVAVRVENIGPHALASFHQPLTQRDARNAIVREIHTR